MYHGKHSKPLFDWRRLAELAAMCVVELIAICLVAVLWLNS